MKNLKLIRPSKEYLNSYLQACREFKELNLLSYSFNDPDNFHEWSETLFEKYEKFHNGIDLPEGYVPSTTLWLVENDEFIGEGNIRHKLTESLKLFGGHIGYAIRSSKWNKGYGTLQLSLLLQEAAKLGIDKALITCDESNTASARVIEKNGGIYMDTIDNIIFDEPKRTKRYWVPTSKA